MTTQIKKIYEVFYDKNNALLEGGYIYIGSANQNPITNPVQTYFDPDLTIPALQPLRTVGGAISNNGSPANIYISNANYSIVIQDKNKKLLYSAIEKSKEIIAIDSIANIINLRLYEPTTDGQIINMLGHTIAGIGGGSFRYDASDTTTADDDGIVIVTAGGKRWKRVLNGFIDSDMYNGNAKRVIENANTKHAIKLLADATISSTIILRSNLIIECNGFTLSPASAIGVLSAQGSVGTFTNLTSSMLQWTNTLVTLLSLNVGDWVFVRSESLYDDPTDPTDPDPVISKYGQIFQITANPSANTYKTDVVARWGFNTANTAQIAKLTVVENLKVYNLKINKETYSNTFTIGFNCVYLVNSEIINPILIGSKSQYGSDIQGRTAIKFNSCVNVKVVNPVFKHIAWYGVEFIGACRNVMVYDLKGHDCRHAVSFNWIDGYGKPWLCGVVNSKADNSTLSGFDSHPNSTEDCYFEGCTSVGSVADSGFQIRSKGIYLKNQNQTYNNFFDGLVCRYVDAPVRIDNFSARFNKRNGIFAQEYGIIGNNIIAEDNLSAGLYVSSARINSASLERNAYAVRAKYNVLDTRKIILNNVYAPFSAGVQTLGVFLDPGYDINNVLFNIEDFTGYGNNLVYQGGTGISKNFDRYYGNDDLLRFKPATNEWDFLTNNAVATTKINAGNVKLDTLNVDTISEKTTNAGVNFTSVMKSANKQVLSAAVLFDATPTILKSFNVSSVARISTGLYEITFATAFADNFYFRTISSDYDGNNRLLYFSSPLTNKIRIVSLYFTVGTWILIDPPIITVEIF